MLNSFYPHRRRALLAAATFAVIGAAPAFAQNWPNGPLKVVLGFAPGGAGDVTARLMAQKYSEALGQPVVVENRPGANSTIAAGYVAKAPGDGNTIYMGTSTDLTVAPTVMAAQVTYNVTRDFTPLGALVTAPNMLVVPAKSPFNSVDELVKYAKANPNKLNFASFGSISTSYLAPEYLKNMTGIQMTHIPFKGSALAITELLAGRIDLFFDTVSSAAPHVKAGKLKALAVTHGTRSPQMPDVPTMAEQGFPQIVFGSTIGMLVPSSTPPEIAKRLQMETAKIMAMPEVRARFLELGMIPNHMEPKAYSEFLKSETARTAKLIKDANLKFE